MRKNDLKNYARLIANVGANIRKGDEVIIRAELDQPEFVEMTVKECYIAGASKVIVEWSHQPLERLNIRYRSLKVMSTVEDWETEKMKHYIKALPVMIYLESDDPEGLVGTNREKSAKARQARYRIMKPYIDELDNKYKWCIASVPGAKWAKRLFPDVSAKKAQELLWEAILETSRAKGDAVENWKAHNASFSARCNILNGLGIRKLRYSSSNGTNLEVGLIPGSRFLGGGETTVSGEFFNPNIPTEEIFITPKRGEAEGIVYSSKPLSYRGELIENFSVRFENGRAVEVHAEKNEELLKQLIAMDDGAAYLGECAMVPYDSPVNKTGILFLNTLFDENACCHLALGEGFTNCINGYENLSLEELHKMGVNDSMIHQDFMIGTPDLKINAVLSDGSEKLIFDGVWLI